MIRYDDLAAVEVEEVEWHNIDGICTTLYKDADGQLWYGDENSKNIYQTTLEEWEEMKEENTWDELSSDEKVERLEEIYSKLDSETDAKIWELYNRCEDDEWMFADDIEKLRKMIYNENEQAGNFNSREFNEEIRKLLR